MNSLLQKIQSGAEKIHPNNHRRLVRALEIIEVTGKTKGDHEEDVGKHALYDHLIVGLDVDREVLYERIGRRVDLMMEQGLARRSREVME